MMYVCQPLQATPLRTRRRPGWWVVLCGLLGLASLPGEVLADQPPTFALTDVTAASGIDFIHSTGGGSEAYIVEGMSAGLATLDYNGDGWMDIYFLNGAALKGTTVDAPLRNALYRNNGDWTFTDVTDEAGVGDLGYGLGVGVADYDGDGDADIYINNYGPNVLYRNEGNGTFINVAAEAGVENGDKVGAGVAFLDIDGDGDLDLYVANYVDFTYDNYVPIVIKGKKYQAGPQYYQSMPDSLYRNNGDGTFTDVSVESGIAAVTSPSMGIVCIDLDSDNDIDIYVCNDGKANCFFQNDGSGVFEEVGLLYGLACDSSGKANASMGVDCGDYDQDGLLDLFVTDYQAEMPVLYHNLGQGLFEDATAKARIPRVLLPHVNWGTAFVDFDNDADQDLYLVCGHFDRIEAIDDRTSMKVRNFVLLNDQGMFSDATYETDGSAMHPESSRGLAVEDFDNDGDIDVIVGNSNAGPTLLRNDSLAENHWIKLKLSQQGMNRDAIGARVRVVTPGRTQIQHTLSGRGYQSHFGSLLHFGLGNHDAQVKVIVDWPHDNAEGWVESQEELVPVNALTEITRNPR